MARRYLVDPLPGPGPVELDGPTAHHLRTVLRVRSGQEIVLFDGRGREATATVTHVERQRLRVTVDAARMRVREPARRIELAFALPKGPRADWLFEHATEVGIAAFRPVHCARSNPDPGRVERWRRIVAAAAGQCDRSHVPAVLEPVALGDLLRDPTLPDERYVALPGATAPLTAPAGVTAVLVVGPEGGLSGDEAERLADAGFRARSLGPLTLRTETAALVGAARLLA